MITSTFNDYKVNLIEDLSEFDYIKSLLSPNVQVGIDTETTGLSYVSDSIVGICISCGKGYSPKEYQGFYIPIRHGAYNKNLPIPETIALVQYLIDNYKTCFFNRNFDISMLEKDGLKFPFNNKSHDAQIMCYLSTSEGYPSLKDYASKYLHMDVIHFEDNNAKDHNFGTTDPRVSYVYGAQDPIITTLLARKLWFDFPYIQKIYPIDNKSSEAVRCFCRDTVIPINYDIISKELSRVVAEQASVRAQIFAITGYEFRLTSTRDKADALCFSDDTEFLTNRGFLKYDDITDNDLIAQYSNGSIEYVVPEGRVSRMSESMYEIKHRYTDLKVTPGHKMWVDLKDGKGYQLIPIDDLVDRARGFNILNSVNVSGVVRIEDFVFNSSASSRRKKHLRIPADAFIEFAGFWLGDGHSTVRPYYKKDGTLHTTYKVGLTQSLCPAKAHTVQWLLDLNERMGKPFTVSYREGRVDFQCSSKEFAEYMESEFKKDGVKRIPSWVFTLSSDQRIAFLEAFLRADGTYNGADVFLAWNPELLEDLKYLCQISGRKCSVVAEKSTEGSVLSVKGIPLKGISKSMYYFSSTRVFTYSHIIPSDIEQVDEPCRVVCFQVPSSVLVVRRNGKVSVCGNCRFVTLTQKTKSGQFAVSDEVLERIDHPLARLMQKYAELEKYRGSYVAKMLDFPKEGIHINYSLVSVPTGRFASGAQKGNDYFANFNIQNVPKIEVMRYVHPDPTLGYVINDDPNGAFCKMKVKGGLRDAFVCPEGYVWLSADYCLDPDSKVLTPSGEIPLKDLHDGDLVITPWGAKPCKNVRSTGKKKVVKITLSSGEVLRCSPDHRIAVKRDGNLLWTTAKELKSTDYIFSKQELNYFTKYGLDSGCIKEDR